MKNNLGKSMSRTPLIRQLKRAQVRLDWSNVGAGQQGRGEGEHLCFGSVRDNWVKCECVLKQAADMTLFGQRWQKQLSTWGPTLSASAAPCTGWCPSALSSTCSFPVQPWLWSTASSSGPSADRSPPPGPPLVLHHPPTSASTLDSQTRTCKFYAIWH